MKYFLLLIFYFCTATAYTQNASFYQPANNGKSRTELYKPLQKKIDQWIKETTRQAEKGDAEAMGKLGYMYLTGHIDADDMKHYSSQIFDQVGDKDKGMALLKKSDSLGSMTGSYYLGQFYYSGGPYHEDWKRALPYFLHAANRGNEESMFKLGEIYQYGSSYGKLTGTEDLAAAKKWYKQAAEHNYQPAKQKLEIIALAEDSAFEKALTAFQNKDYQTAFTLWHVCYETYRTNTAAFNIGVLFYNGQLKYDESEARFWFEIAGDLGHAQGSFLAGNIWNEMGERGQAIKWWEKASQQGYAAANESVLKTKKEIASDIQRRESEMNAYNQKKSAEANSNATVNTNNTKATTQATKTCPVCNGTGKLTDRYTTEKRDWGNKTLTFTDHVTTKVCSRCDGSGKITY